MQEKISYVLFCIYLCNNLALGQSGRYVIPAIELSALSPKGFRAELSDSIGVQQFGFHAKLNSKLEPPTEGDLNGNIYAPTNLKWVYEDLDFKLNIGDKIYYWIYVKNNGTDYTKQDLIWEVKEFFRNTCTSSSTTVSGVDERICAGNIIFDDEFDGDKVDRNKWTVQKYIPSIADDDHYEFVSYQDRDENIFIRNSVLHLKPIAAKSRVQIFGGLNLAQGCTRSKPISCGLQQVGGYILPPVVSAKIISKMSFKYGTIEIKAKLPIGDWIYPQVELIPKGKLPPYPKMLIAYTRGNRNLTTDKVINIGNRLLFGGPQPKATSPDPLTSFNLRSIRLATPAGSKFRTYRLSWSPAKIDLAVDDELYGSILSHKYRGLDTEYHIALGVGVGGNYDFPDNSRIKKPWKNFDLRPMKDFFDQKDFWMKTWIDDDVDLQLDSVKVWAV